jgi:hypothetical protein
MKPSSTTFPATRYSASGPSFALPLVAVGMRAIAEHGSRAREEADTPRLPQWNRPSDGHGGAISVAISSS